MIEGMSSRVFRGCDCCICSTRDYGGMIGDDWICLARRMLGGHLGFRRFGCFGWGSEILSKLVVRFGAPRFRKVEVTIVISPSTPVLIVLLLFLSQPSSPNLTLLCSMLRFDSPLNSLFVPISAHFLDSWSWDRVTSQCTNRKLSDFILEEWEVVRRVLRWICL